MAGAIGDPAGTPPPAAAHRGAARRDQPSAVEDPGPAGEAGPPGGRAEGRPRRPAATSRSASTRTKSRSSRRTSRSRSTRASSATSRPRRNTTLCSTRSPTRRRSAASLEDAILEGMTKAEEQAARIPELEKALKAGKDELARFETTSKERVVTMTEELRRTQGQLKEVETTLPDGHPRRPTSGWWRRWAKTRCRWRRTTPARRATRR